MGAESLTVQIVDGHGLRALGAQSVTLCVPETGEVQVLPGHKNMVAVLVEGQPALIKGVDGKTVSTGSVKGGIAEIKDGVVNIFSNPV
jgi:F0F1-type ATP synthase epsilon subunit